MNIGPYSSFDPNDEENGGVPKLQVFTNVKDRFSILEEKMKKGFPLTQSELSEYRLLFSRKWNGL